MRVILESTDRIVTLVGPESGKEVEARVWEGTTEDGVAVTAFVARVAVKVDDDRSRFEAELLGCGAPRSAREAWPRRMVL